MGAAVVRCPLHNSPPPWTVNRGPGVLYGESTNLLLGAPLVRSRRKSIASAITWSVVLRSVISVMFLLQNLPSPLRRRGANYFILFTVLFITGTSGISIASSC